MQYQHSTKDITFKNKVVLGKEDGEKSPIDLLSGDAMESGLDYICSAVYCVCKDP